MSWIEWLVKLDKFVFILIHQDSDQNLLDPVIPWFRNPLTWIPLYLGIFYFAVTRLKGKALRFIFFSVVTVLITDQLSAGIFKPLFERPRPCFDPLLQAFIRNLVDCGGRYSFPSSHAANHFGLAAFWYWTIRHFNGKKCGWLWLWALLVGYAQVYVGKHYPFDILAGALMGMLTGTALAKIFDQWPPSFKISLPAFFRKKSLEDGF
jgi:membrane-associated phospholipid phosphatase